MNIIALIENEIKNLNTVTLYHGSKHLFDVFDMSKINTGQRSQDFGYGLYFTSNKKTAEFYANEISNTRTPIEKYQKYVLTPTHDDNILIDYLKSNNIFGAKRILSSIGDDEYQNLLLSLNDVERYGYVYTVQVNKPNFMSRNEYIALKHQLSLDDKAMNNVLLGRGYNGIEYPINSFGLDKSTDYGTEFNVVVIDDQILTITDREKVEFKGYLKLKNF